MRAFEGIGNGVYGVWCWKCAWVWDMNIIEKIVQNGSSHLNWQLLRLEERGGRAAE
jgi:hypothetical protein